MDCDARFLSLPLFILCLHCTGIFFFTGGFLLTRTELSSTSTCDDLAEASGCNLHPNWSHACHGNCSETAFECVHAESTCLVDEMQSTQQGEQKSGDRGDAAGKCWTKPLVKRTIILIIDALRFDFVAPTSNSTDEAAPWMNHLEILQMLLTEGFSAKVFKFVADPPTTTLQRLKGLTTGGLPTFMDIGQSFGASAIVEDNLLLQLLQMGRKVIMMGDDTWMQLFPFHFAEAYPFPSLNVKDLHTVDDGVIKEIFPALQRENWDVLIAHFLGVDHVGHIFGVESPFMVEKLRQYNQVIKDILKVLLNESKPGGLHEDTLLIVMGDHGQTLNGDHGGGTPEEVDTAMVAVTTRNLPSLLELDLPFSQRDFDNHKPIATFPQLDFASTLAAIMGTPIPFGSVGQVNPILWSLAAGVEFSTELDGGDRDHEILKSLHDYLRVLCVNSWQVKRYLQEYSACAMSSFPVADILRLEQLYGALQALPEDIFWNASSLDAAKQQIYSYTTFLSAAASLARSQWTQFRLDWMTIGVAVLLAALAVQSIALYRAIVLGQIRRVSHQRMNTKWFFPAKDFLFRSLVLTSVISIGVATASKLVGTFSAIMVQLKVMLPGLLAVVASLLYILPKENVRSQRKVLGSKGIIANWCQALTLQNASAVFFVFLHTCSLFSNSFIVGEGSVLNFFMASTGVLYLRQHFQSRSKPLKAVCFCLLNAILVAVGHMAESKDSTPAKNLASYFELWKVVAGVSWRTFVLVPLPLLVLGWLIAGLCRQPHLKSTQLVLRIGVPISYVLVILHWLITDVTACVSSLSASEDNAANGLFTFVASKELDELSRLQLPRMVFITSIVLTLIVLGTLLSQRRVDQKLWQNVVNETIISLLAGWSGTMIFLIGKKGPLIFLLAVLEAWCLREMQFSNKRRLVGISLTTMVDWNFVALQLFFVTGHRCTFDGLHYDAAFMGFDEFNFFRQGFLLALDTFGTSHLLPVMAIPLLIPSGGSLNLQTDDSLTNDSLLLNMAQLYLSYGLIRTITTIASVLCSALQRRHLMVWGLFAPKYVFDVVGLLMTDIFILLAMLVILCCRRRTTKAE